MRRTKEDSQQTRDVLIKTAYRLFGSRGYRQTTQLDVAREPGLTRGPCTGTSAAKGLVQRGVEERLPDVPDDGGSDRQLRKSVLVRLDELLYCLASLIVNDPPYRAMQSSLCSRRSGWRTEGYL
jgi:hypothetical protein